MRNGELARLVRVVAQGVAGSGLADASDHRTAVRVLHAVNDAGYCIVTQAAYGVLAARARHLQLTASSS